MEQQAFSLLEVSTAIRDVIKGSFVENIWIYAEISEIHTKGHCYLELIEKNDKNQTVARQKATIWSNVYDILRPYFEETTGLELQAGMRIMALCSVEMHTSYGISLNIKDINPEYTVGEILLEKRKIIDQLTKDGIIDLNRELPLPILPQRVAVISSKTAAGYEDFYHQIEKNIYGYRFDIELFDAIMQGENTQSSVIMALDKIYKKIDDFDIVVMIRGGGATSDLSAFNDYDIASHIAQFPLPIICGIGHQRDETVIDLVSAVSLKTPTAVAEYLISTFRQQEDTIDDIYNSLVSNVSNAISYQKELIKDMSRKLSYIPKNFVNRQLQTVDYHQNKIISISKDIVLKSLQDIDYKRNMVISMSKNIVANSLQKIDILDKKLRIDSKVSVANELNNIHTKEKIVELMSPNTILKRGYSIVKQNNKFVKSLHNVDKNNDFTIIFHDGKLKAKSK